MTKYKFTKRILCGCCNQLFDTKESFEKHLNENKNCKINSIVEDIGCENLQLFSSPKFQAIIMAEIKRRHLILEFSKSEYIKLKTINKN